MGDSRATASAPPGPDGVASLDELVERLRALRAWSGVSYRELHRRLARRRRTRGIPEEPAYATVYRCLQPGRTRLDIDLVADIVAELTDDSEADRWRQVYTQVIGETSTATTAANVLDRLPDDLPAFTGRDTELAQILHHAQGGGIIAIEGMAGVGKTTLAIRAAHRILEQDDQIEIILSVNLHGHDPDRSPVQPMAVLDGFLRRLGMTGGRIQTLDRRDRVIRLHELIANRAALVLLDNAASEDQIDPLLPDAPNVLVLVTSRRRVVRRTNAQAVALDVLSSDQAIELLRTHAGDKVDAPPEVSGQIVDQVGHLPLAVALVAARIRASSGWTLEDHLDQLFERRDALQVDRGVEVAFATSYEALPPSQRRMLRLLAAHPGRDCDAYAAAALAGTALEVARRQLADLAVASLLSSRITGRYELHDLVRVFALSHARDDDAPSARRAAATRLIDHYRWTAAIAMDVYAPEEQERRPQVPESGTQIPTISDRTTAVNWLEAELPNLVAIGTYAAEHGWSAHVGDLSATLAPYLLAAAHYADASRLHREASTVTKNSRRANALKNLGVTHWHQGNAVEADAVLARALDLARSIGDRSTEGRCLTNLGNVRQHQGKCEEARDLFRRALAIGRQVGDRTAESRILMNIGLVDQMLGDCERAVGHQVRALELARSQHDRSTEMHALENLSHLYTGLGQYQEARRHAQESAAIAEELGNPAAMSEALTSMGSSHMRQGELEVALDYQQRALSIAQSIAGVRVEFHARVELGRTLRESGDPELAVTHHRHALEIASTVDATHLLAQALDCLGADYAKMGDIAAARSLWHQSLDLFRELRLPDADRLQAQLAKLEPSLQVDPDAT